MTWSSLRVAPSLIAAGALCASGCNGLFGAAPAASATAVPATASLAANAPAGLTWGGDVRVRDEYFNNALSLSETVANHEQDLFRVRLRLWSAVAIAPDLSVNLRFAAEPRIWERPAFAKQHPGTGTEWRYGILDNLNVKWTHAFDLPLTITAGRQDIQFGEVLNWWLVGDGTPGDGSWAFFLDSVRATFDAAEIKTKFDLIGIDQHARPDGWLPIVGSANTYSVVEQNERGLILYATNQSVPGAQLDGFFIWKHDDAVFAYSDTGDIYTAGAKAAGSPGPNWKYSLEGAWQWGWKRDTSVRTPVNLGTLHRDIQACGANGRLTYLFKDPRDNQLTLVGEYLSGDDPNTQGTDEMFDILWGRWPRFSELYIYSYPMETAGKVAQLNNLLRLGASWSFAPVKGTTVNLAYNAWFAPQSVPTRALNPALFSRTGHFRGHFFQLWVKRKFSPALSGQVWAELVRPGDFYARRDLMSYLRAEMQVTF